MRIGFGSFVLDTEARELSFGTELLHLSPKAFTLLELLVKEKPRAISKSELLDRIWPDELVQEQNIKNLVAEIRAALDDPQHTPRFIRTVHRFGYAFRGETWEEHPGDLPPGPAMYLQAESRRYRLVPGENLIGRDPKVAVWIDSPDVSRHHGRIVVASGKATLEDLGSKNGTWADGRPVTEKVELRDGDQVRLGPSIMLVFHARSADQPTISALNRQE